MFRFDRETLRAPVAQTFSETREVRFQDVDAANVIFYPRLLEYCHDLLVRFYMENGAPLDEVLRTGRFLAPIRHAEADYFKPLRFGDRIEVALVRAHLEPTEVTLGFRVARGNEICAVVQSVHAFLDPASFRRIDVPEPLRSAWAKLQG